MLRGRAFYLHNWLEIEVKLAFEVRGILEYYYKDSKMVQKAYLSNLSKANRNVWGVEVVVRMSFPMPSLLSEPPKLPSFYE